MDRGPGAISATALVCAPRVQHACVSTTGKSLGLSATKSVCHLECPNGGLNLLKVFALGVAAGCFFLNCLPITTPLDPVGMFAGVTLNALGPVPPRTAPRRHVGRKVAQKQFGLVSLQTVAACRTRRSLFFVAVREQFAAGPTYITGGVSCLAGRSAHHGPAGSAENGRAKPTGKWGVGGSLAI